VSGGQGFTAGQGSIAAVGLTLALVGSSIAVTPGEVFGSEHGQQIVVSAGTLTFVITQDIVLEGSSSSVAAGTLAPRHTLPALTGLSAASSGGSVTPEGNDVTTHIGGEEATFAQGETSSSSALVGIASTTGRGIVAPSFERPLLGEPVACSAGTVTADQQVIDTRIDSGQGSATVDFVIALTGVPITTGSGTVAVTEDRTATLLGHAATASTGSMGFERAFELTGSLMTVAPLFMGAPGGADLTGAEVAATAGDVFITDDRAYAITGVAVAVSAGTVVPSQSAELVGQLREMGQGRFSHITLPITGESITVFPGSVGAPLSDAAAPDYPIKKPKKRYVQKIGDRLVVFPSAELALAAVVAADQPAELDSPAPVEEEAVPIQKIEAIAKAYKQEAKVEEARKSEDYEQMLKVYEELMKQREEEDIERLLLTYEPIPRQVLTRLSRALKKFK
jgi:hypothetical protein